MRRFVLALILLGMAMPAHAEQLLFDHRLYPPLEAAFDSKRDDVILFERRPDGVQFDRIMVQGRSVSDWDEAMEITVSKRSRKQATAQEALDSWRKAQDATCPAQWSELARDDGSITVEQTTPPCTGAPARQAIWRLMLGPRSVFVIGGVYRGMMPAPMRQSWLALLASARIG